MKVLLRPVILFMLILLLASCPVDGGQVPLPANPGIRGIILFIGDGMGRPSENLASRYLYGAEHRLAWDSFPVHAWVSTWDVTSYNTRAGLGAKAPWNPSLPGSNDPLTGYAPLLWGKQPWPDNMADGTIDQLGPLLLAATDSASAATAMSCGVKTDKGNIAWATGDKPDGALENIGEYLAKTYGMDLGIITTVPLSHATPAAFGAHNTGRGNYHDIALEMIRYTKPKVLIGGGNPDQAGNSWIDPALIQEARDTDEWVIAQRQSGLNGTSSLMNAAWTLGRGKRLLGLFGGADGAWEAPVPANVPGLPSFTRNAENPRLADAVYAALEVLGKSSHGFILMVEQGDIDWANHANNLPRMIGTTASMDEAVQACINRINIPGDGLSSDNVLVLVTSDHATGALRYDATAPAIPGSLALPGLVWHSKGHSNELVGIHAWGARSALVDNYRGLMYPGTSIIDNTDIYRIMKAAAAP